MVSEFEDRLGEFGDLVGEFGDRMSLGLGCGSLGSWWVSLVMSLGPG